MERGRGRERRKVEEVIGGKRRQKKAIEKEESEFSALPLLGACITYVDVANSISF